MTTRIGVTCALLPCALLQGLACGSPDETTTIAETAIPAAGVDPGTPDVNGTPTGANDNPLYAIMYEVYDDIGSTSYLSLLDSLDTERIDESQAREYGGGRAFLQTYDGAIFVGDAATPNVTRYGLGADGGLLEQGTVSFGNFGLEAGNLDTWNVSFISPAKAYLFDFEQGITIIWNPTTMEIVGEIAPPPQLFRDGLSLDGSPGVIRGNRLFRTFHWVNDDTAAYSTDLLLGVYDVEGDTLIELVEETRCPATGNLAHQDELGNIYFSNWIWPVAGTLLRGAPESCVLRINVDSERFDPAWTFRYSELADGRQGAMFTYLGNAQGLFAAFYDERTTFDATTNPWDYVGSPNWRIWSFDLDTSSAAPVAGIDWNTGAFTPARLDGRTFVMVPGEGWATTQLFEVKDGNAVPAITVPGWTYQFVKVR